MSATFLHLTLINFFLNAMVYSVHNFIIVIVGESGVADLNQILKLQVLYGIKFIAAMMFTSFCDKKGGHKYVLTISAVLFCSGALLLTKLEEFDEKIRFNFIIVGLFMYTVGNGGLFPIIDSLTFKYLRKIGKTERIGRLRFAGSLGQLVSNFFLAFIHYLKKDTGCVKHIPNAYTCAAFAIVLSIISLLLSTKNIYTEEDAQIASERQKTSEIWENFKRLITIVSFCYFISVLFAGIDRQGISNFLTMYFGKVGVATSAIHVILLWRTLPELIIYGLSEFLARFLALDVIFMMAIFITVSRSFFYAFVDVSDFTEKQKFFFSLFSETSKGFYSALFHYSAMRIFNSFADSKNVSIAQGAFYSAYNSLPYMAFPLFSPLFAKSKDKHITLAELQTLFKLVGTIAILGLVGPIVRLFHKGMKSKKCQFV
ncbi:Major Facilitator Superfamily (MFS) [Pseudoloma neurophilia]|uniref:Major Facilitator Superfamily (MFS) n=1 Tax=Pseudoloma neurophilia TaxID=146866 RepID=A0A0R0LU77_9MICR|nr:Major Facilitator Superfamily (MFS) [Pseudoloma neurophilia]